MRLTATSPGAIDAVFDSLSCPFLVELPFESLLALRTDHCNNHFLICSGYTEASVLYDELTFRTCTIIW